MQSSKIAAASISSSRTKGTNCDCESIPVKRKRQLWFIVKFRSQTAAFVKIFRQKILRQHYVEVHLDDGSVAAKTVKALGLSQTHLRQLKKKFDDIDRDKSGFIDSIEFFQMFDEEKSPFTNSLFNFIDLDNSGTIVFDEFVKVCARYCMFTENEILRFWFDCYDEDGSGAIDEDEFIELCRTVNNKSPLFPGNFVQVSNYNYCINKYQIFHTETNSIIMKNRFH